MVYSTCRSWSVLGGGVMLFGAAFAAEPTAAPVPLPSILFYRSDTGIGVGGTFSSGLFVQGATYGFSAGWDVIALTRDSAFFYDSETGMAAFGTMVGGVFRQTGVRQLTAGYDQGAGSCDTVALYDTATGRLESRKLAAGALGTTVDYDKYLGLAASSVTATCDSLLLRAMGSLDLSNYVAGTLTGGRFVLKTRFQGPSYVSIAGATDTVLLWGGYAAGKNATANLTAGRFTPRTFANTNGPSWPVLLAASRDSTLIYSTIPGLSLNSGYRGKLQGGVYTELATPLALSSGWTHIVGGK